MQSFLQSLNPSSRPSYERWINKFHDEVEQNVPFPNANQDFNDSHHGAIMTFFQLLHQDYATTTLWSINAIIKRYLQIQYKYELDKNLPNLEKLLKQWQKSEEIKKAPTFSQDNIKTFIENAPDEKYIVAKVIFSIGLHGLMRSSELIALDCDDVVTNSIDASIQIKMKRKKNSGPQAYSFFLIKDEMHKQHIIKYIQLQKEKNIYSGRFFKHVRIVKGSLQAINSNVGHNYFGAMCREAATYLNLTDPSKYTTHTLRRSGATILADAGLTTLELQRAGGWKSSTVAETYVAGSKQGQLKVASAISPNVNSSIKIHQIQSSETVTSYTQPAPININLSLNGATLTNSPINITLPSSNNKTT